MANNYYVVFPKDSGFDGRKNNISEKEAMKLAGSCLGAIAYDSENHEICRGTAESVKKFQTQKPV